MTGALPLMIFAAGFGRRMGDLTAHRPKPLIKVGQKTLLECAHEIGATAGCEPIAVNAHYLAPQIIEAATKLGCKVSAESDHILDTGGGLKNALPLVPGPAILTLNPDAVWSGPNPLTQLIQHGLPDHLDAVLLLVERQRAIARIEPGDFSQDASGQLNRKGAFVYTGAQIIRRSLAKSVSDDVFSMNRLWDLAIEKGRLGGITYSGEWCDVGRPEGITIAEKLLSQSELEDRGKS